MNSDQFISMNFEDALHIAALCDDLGISSDDAKLFVYIHAKSSNHPKGIQCFDEKKEEEILALEIMLGKKNMAALTSATQCSEECSNLLQNFSSSLKDSITDLDHIVREGCGLEFHFRSQLLRRLRFHTDETFKREKLLIFSTMILPRMKDYGKGKAQLESERQKKKAPFIIVNFKDSLN